MWPRRVKMPTQNLLRLLLLLMLVTRIVLATVCGRFGSWGLVKKLNFCSDFEHKVWSRFRSWSKGEIWSWSLVSFFCWCFVEVIWILVEILKLGLANIFKFNFSRDVWDFEVDTCSRFWSMKFDQDLCATCDMNSTLGSVVPLAMFYNQVKISTTLLFFSVLFIVISFICAGEGSVSEVWPQWRRSPELSRILPYDSHEVAKNMMNF